MCAKNTFCVFLHLNKKIYISLVNDWSQIVYTLLYNKIHAGAILLQFTRKYEYFPG